MKRRDVDVDAVSALVQRVAADIVVPGWRALSASDVDEKSPGEWVTRIDRTAEAALTCGLRELLPGAPVIGEEAASEDPSLTGELTAADAAWLVDPLDGTRNYIDGTDQYAIMIALVRRQQTVAAWILQPARSRLYVAEAGAGTWRNGTRVHRQPAAIPLGQLRGAVLTRFLSDRQRAAVAAAGHRFARIGLGRYCAGIDYPDIVEGGQDFVLFWRTLPWDHAAGALIVTEGGGVAAHLGGQPYSPALPQAGLLVASSAEVHREVVVALRLDQCDGGCLRRVADLACRGSGVRRRGFAGDLF
jgi:fructose-1,6-bisphosphatase/inositol monophosphatase family enzyme